MRVLVMTTEDVLSFAAFKGAAAVRAAWEALSVAVVTLVLARSKLFLPLRVRLARRGGFLHGLLSCTFCTSVWVAGAHVVAAPVGLVSTWLPVSALVDVFAVAALAAPVAVVVYHAHLRMPTGDPAPGGNGDDDR